MALYRAQLAQQQQAAALALARPGAAPAAAGAPAARAAAAPAGGAAPPQRPAGAAPNLLADHMPTLSALSASVGAAKVGEIVHRVQRGDTTGLTEPQVAAVSVLLSGTGQVAAVVHSADARDTHRSAHS
jgi:hypothetical protein